MQSCLVLCALVVAHGARLGEHAGSTVEGPPRFTEAELAAMRGKSSELTKRFRASPAGDQSQAKRSFTGKRLQCWRLAQEEYEDDAQQNAARQKQCLRMAAELRLNAGNKRLHCDWSEDLNVCFNTNRAEDGESEVHASARKKYRESHPHGPTTDFAEGSPGQGTSMEHSEGAGDFAAGAVDPLGPNEPVDMDEEGAGAARLRTAVTSVTGGSAFQNALVPSLLMFVKASVPQDPNDYPDYSFYVQAQMGKFKWRSPKEKRSQGNEVRWEESLASLLVQPEDELDRIYLSEHKPNSMDRRYIQQKSVKPATQTLTNNGASLTLTDFPLKNWFLSKVGGSMAGDAANWQNSHRVVVFEAASGLPKILRLRIRKVYVLAEVMRSGQSVAKFKSLKVPRATKQEDGTYTAIFERHTSCVLLAAGETLSKVQMLIYDPNTANKKVLDIGDVDISERSQSVSGSDGAQLTVRVVPL